MVRPMRPAGVRAARVDLDAVHVRRDQLERRDRVVELLVGDRDQARARRGANRASAAAAASAPAFGRPIAFTSARRAGSRAIRGRRLPARGRSVTVPPTTKPNPSRPSASRWRHSLSNPAANPIGLRSGIPASEVASEGSVHRAADPRPRQRQPEQPLRDPMGGLRVHREERPAADGLVPTHRDPILGRVDGDLVRRMLDASELHGEFVLSSGATSSVYFDKFRFLTRAGSACATWPQATGALLAPGTELLGAPEGAAMLLVAAVSLQTGLPVSVVRKQPKAYGTRAQVEGVVPPGRHHDAPRRREHHRPAGAGGGRGPDRGRRRRRDGSCSRSTGAARIGCGARATRWRRSRCCGLPGRDPRSDAVARQIRSCQSHRLPR